MKSRKQLCVGEKTGHWEGYFMKKKLLVSASAAIFCMLPEAVMAQSSTGQSNGDQANEDRIVVTATRREESLQDVPLAITAFTQDELTEKGIVGYEGIAFETPGTVLNQPSANFNNFTVRGITTNGYGANLQSTVTIYVDELPISANGNSTILDPTLFDVERVEFLRGPQGTLFGSGSLAGAMRFLTKSPDLDEFDTALAVDLGLTDDDSVRQRYNGMLNIPLVEDKLAVRAVGFYRNEEGWVTNVGTGIENANTLVNWGGRVIVLWEPTDRASLRLMALHEESDPEDSSFINPTRGGGDRETRTSRRPDIYAGNLDSYNATLTLDLGFADFISSTTYADFEQKFYVDLDATFNFFVPFALDADAAAQSIVEEARLVSKGDSKLECVAGLFYFSRQFDLESNQRTDPAFLVAQGLTGLSDEYFLRRRTSNESHELAGFGELTYRFSDQFWLTAGLRYGTTKVQGFTDGGYTSNYIARALSFVPGPITITQIAAAEGAVGKESGPSYKFSASFKPADNVTTYATYSTGFRTPVVNARAGVPSFADPTDPFVIPAGADSDNLRNYELGVKGNWFDGKLQTNIAAYYIDWKDIQVQANRVSDQVHFATNIGGARSLGFEFEIDTYPTEGLSIGLNGSVNDTEVNDLTAAEAEISGAVEGIQLAFPTFQGSVYLKYVHPITNDIDAFFTVNARHVGDYPNQFPFVPGQPGVPSPTYTTTESYQAVNMSLGANIGDHFKASLYVENLTDDHSIIYSHPEAFADSRASTLRPRTIGLRFNYDY